MNGSVVNLGPDAHGRNRFRVFLPPVNEGGKTRRPSHVVYAENAAEAERELFKLHAKRYDSSMSFAEWVKVWRSETASKREPGTWADYDAMLKNRIIPNLGKYRLDQLQPRHIHAFMVKLSSGKEQVGKPYQVKFYNLISVILQEACYGGLLSVNPVRQVRPPRTEKHTPGFFQGEEITALVQALDAQPLFWQMVVSMSLLLGARRGEVVALRWSDIDRVKSIAEIRRSAYKVTGKPQVVKEPKTSAGIRNVPIPSGLMALLDTWQAEQGGSGEDYICATKHQDGLQWLAVDSATLWFRRFVVKYGLQKVTFHGLRHTNATIQMDAGIPLPAIAKYLGHASSSFTADIYTHATKNAENQILQAISNVFAPKTALKSAETE